MEKPNYISFVLRTKNIQANHHDNRQGVGRNRQTGRHTDEMPNVRPNAETSLRLVN